MQILKLVVYVTCAYFAYIGKVKMICNSFLKLHFFNFQLNTLFIKFLFDDKSLCF